MSFSTVLTNIFETSALAHIVQKDFERRSTEKGGMPIGRQHTTIFESPDLQPGTNNVEFEIRVRNDMILKTSHHGRLPNAAVLNALQEPKRFTNTHINKRKKSERT